MSISTKNDQEPKNYEEAWKEVDLKPWKKAMNLGMESIYFNNVWTLAEPPVKVKPIGCKWIYKKKR